MGCFGCFAFMSECPAPVRCRFGRASKVFPLALEAQSARQLLAQEAPPVAATVRGYTTELTWEAGACSLRLELGEVEEGNVKVVVRHGKGWLPGEMLVV